jgi:amidase
MTVIKTLPALAAMPAAIVVADFEARVGTSFADYDGLGLADLVRRKQASATELLDWAIARAEVVNPVINCLAFRHYEQAKAQIKAGLPAGAFSGVPFVLKDLNIMLAGTITSNGSLAFKDRVASFDSELVKRYKQAGLVIFSKMTSPEFGLGATTESKAFGQTRNPWNLERVAGGSSGGSAAAVAAGIVPMAQGSDGGGSLRIPASCNGLFGLKPSRGRIPTGPALTEGWFGLSVRHAITRTVRDSAALMDISCGMEPGSRYTAPPTPAGSFVAETRQHPGRLHVALMLSDSTGLPLDAECVTAARSAASLCESLGHHVEEAAPMIDTEALRSGFITVVASAIAQMLRDRGVERGTPVSQLELDAVPWWFYEQGQRFSALMLTDANAAFQRAAVAVARFMSRFDVILSPTLAKPPVKLGTLNNASADAPALRRCVAAFSPFTLIANCTGQPAMSLPLHWTADGLPVGVMFMARYGDEATLFRLAAQFEQARPWAQWRPVFG